MNTNELAFLKANHVKPVAWRLTAVSRNATLPGFGYTLEFTHHQQHDKQVLVSGCWLSPWHQVHTRRGEPKEYKTADAAIKDIHSVQGDLEAVVYLRYG